MLSLLLPPSLLALIAALALITTTTAAFLVLLPFALLKFMVPLRGFRGACNDLINAIALHWVEINRLLYELLYPQAWDVEIGGELDPSKSYLLVSNHQSWADIMVLVDVFHQRTPFPRFFVKRELMWVPVIGLACWAMEMPFMKRYSKEVLEKYPHLKGEDLEATRRACEKYRGQPVTVVNFLEGTRFSEAKRLARRSPHRHLLPAKAAGLSFALNAMGDQFAGVLNVTIAYQSSKYPIALSFLAGEQTRLTVHAEVQPLPQDLLAGDYQNDPAFRARFQAWVNGLWTRKDAKLDKLIAGQSTAVRPRMT
ncbi:MAG: acyltransferase [Hydrocarboniphaga effusa]|nr:acyltransferase [Hydrocarboniphaga effusa]